MKPRVSLTRILLCCLYLSFFSNGFAAIISGTIFEDVNYGGGAGRSFAASAGVARSGARVELANSAGVYISTISTNASGLYAFTVAAGTYYIRVVNSSVTSSRPGATAACRAVQTYCTDASSGSAIGITDFIGGTNPALVDPGNSGAGATFNTTTYVYTVGLTGTAQSVARVVAGATNITGVDFGFNFNTIVNKNNSGQGSLHQFITNANILNGEASLLQVGLIPARENAVFMISNGSSSAGLRSTNNYFTGSPAVASITITMPTTIPYIATTMVLDAQKQPGWSSSPVIELNGASAGVDTSGMTITGANCIIKGFLINRFDEFGINVNSNGNTISGNYIGVNASGTAALGNLRDGISLNNVTNNVIGGTTVSDRNVISGNSNAANDADGIWINGSSGNFIRGNYLGTNAAGTASIPNYHGGVTITGTSTNNIIGGTNPGEGNLISGNGNGVMLIPWLGTPTNNAILSNSIYGNSGLGIDIAVAGVTANNGSKNAAICNYGMDHPVFTLADLTGTSLTLTGYVGSAAGQAAFANVTVQVFTADNDGSGFGEGQTYLGTLTTSATNGNFSGTLTVSGLTLANQITGTATDAANNTSEFGMRATLISLLPINLFNVSVQRKNDFNLVKWQSENGSNPEYFEVERSTDARSFHKITTIAGNSEGRIPSYSFLDAIPGSGAVWYRIRSIDHTGKSVISRAVTIGGHSMDNAGFTISNPVHLTISVTSENNRIGNYNYYLVNTAGCIVHKGKLNQPGGSRNSITLPAAIKPGIYILRIIGDHFLQQEKLFIQ